MEKTGGKWKKIGGGGGGKGGRGEGRGGKGGPYKLTDGVWKNTLIEWAIMDTYDALGAKYDSPLSLNELEKIGREIGLNNFKVRKSGPILILNGKK